jgi:hypothetical protein
MVSQGDAKEERTLQIAARMVPQWLPQAIQMSAKTTNSSKHGFQRRCKWAQTFEIAA